MPTTQNFIRGNICYFMVKYVAISMGPNFILFECVISLCVFVELVGYFPMQLRRKKLIYVIVTYNYGREGRRKKVGESGKGIH